MENKQIPGADIAQQIIAANSAPAVEQPPQPESQLGAQISELSRQTGMDPAAIQMQLAKNSQQITGSTNLAPVQNIEQLSLKNSQPQDQSLSPAPVSVNQEAPALQDFSAASTPVQAPEIVPQAAQPSGPTAQQQYINQFSTQQKASEKIADAQIKLEKAKEAQFEEKAVKAAEAAETVKNIDTNYQEQYAQRIQALDTSLEEFRKLSAEKPQTAAEIWDKKSTGQKIQASIAIALGGIGAALQGGGASNQAYNIIQKSLQDEADSFNSLTKNKMAAEEKAGNIAITGAKMAADFAGTLQENALKRRLLQYEIVESKINQMASQYNSPQIQENAKILISKIEQDKLKARMEYDALAKQQAMSSALGNMTVEQYSKLSPVQKAAIPKDIRESFEKDTDLLVPGYGTASNKNLATKFSDYKASVEPAIAGAKRVLDIAKDLNRVTDLKKRAQISTEIRALVGQLRLPFTGPGAMTDKEYDRLLETIGNPADFVAMPSLQKARLVTVLKKLEKDLSAAATSAGLPPKTADRIYKEVGFAPLIPQK